MLSMRHNFSIDFRDTTATAMHSDSYPKWHDLDIHVTVNREIETVALWEEDFSALTFGDRQRIFAHYYGVATADVVDFGVRALRRRTVVWGTVAGKVRRLVFAMNVEEELIGICSSCRRFVGVLGTPCGMLTCNGTDAIHDLPLGAVPRTP